jgi:hypothetical protein
MQITKSLNVYDVKDYRKAKYRNDIVLAKHVKEDKESM